MFCKLCESVVTLVALTKTQHLNWPYLLSQILISSTVCQTDRQTVSQSVSRSDSQTGSRTVWQSVSSQSVSAIQRESQSDHDQTDSHSHSDSQLLVHLRFSNVRWTNIYPLCLFTSQVKPVLMIQMKAQTMNQMSMKIIATRVERKETWSAVTHVLWCSTKTVTSPLSGTYLGKNSRL